MTPQGESAWLTVAQAATVLGVSAMTVYRQVWDDKIPSRRVGRAIRIPLSAVTPAETGERVA